MRRLAATTRFCGIVNPTNGTTSPWPFTDKSDNHTLPQRRVLRGRRQPQRPTINLGDECFSSVASETRSSTSPTATLKDFVLGNFGQCGSTTVTTPVQNDGTTAIPAAGLSIGASATVLVKDSARVTATGGGGIKPTGTVSFSLCGPTLLSDADYTLCATGGTPIRSAKALSGTDNPATVVSDAATVTSAGRYCWRAEYSGDAAKGIPGSSDSLVSECFKINPLTPTLATQAGAGPVNLGTAVTDTATLTGTADKPGSPIINPTAHAPRRPARSPSSSTRPTARRWPPGTRSPGRRRR